jgi:4-amino-4-deoxy-L-arabinose transferase-like glycosyltransferase
MAPLIGSGAGLLVTLLAIRLAEAGLILLRVDLSQDEEFYDEIARNLLDGFGFTHDPAAGPNLWRAPVYPLFLAGLLALRLPLSISAPIAQTLLDAGTSWLVYRLFRDVGCRTALLAGALTWVNPLLTYYSLRLLSESLFTFLLTAALFLLHRAGPTTGLTAAGIVCGAATLCRVTLAGFPALVAFWLAHRFPERRRLLAPAVFIATFLVTLSPWLWRNVTVSGTLMLGTGAGYNFWLGNHQPTLGLDTDQLEPSRARMLEERVQQLTSGRSRLVPEVQGAFAEAAWAELRSSPRGFVSLLGRKFGRLWFEVYGPKRQWLQPLVIPIQAVFLGTCLAGLCIGWSSRGAPFGLALLVVGYFAVLHTLTVATLRYMVPLIPVMSGFAALALVHGLDRLRASVPLAGAGPGLS